MTCFKGGRSLVAVAVLAATLSVGATVSQAAPSPGDAVNCTDFSFWEDAREWFWTHFVEHGDVANLDSDDDGDPCESLPSKAATTGYWMLTESGRVFSFGTARASVPDQSIFLSPGEVAVKMLANPGGAGAWILTSNGRVVPLGGAPDHGDVKDIIAPEGEWATFAATPTGDGYWVFTTAGHVFGLGAATNHGSLAGVSLAGEVIDSAPTPTGLGYWLLGSDGGMFALGDAGFFGSMGGSVLNQPAVGLVPDPDNVGYWFVAADGGVFAFDAPFVGSVPAVLAPGAQLAAPVNGMVPYGDGYLMVASDGGVFNFSSSAFLGSLGAVNVGSPVVAIAPV